MRIRVEDHKDYKKIGYAEYEALCDKAKTNLRVGFEVEFNYFQSSDEPIDDRYALNTLSQISDEFEKQHGFKMAIGKGACSKKLIKRHFSDGHTRIEVPVEVEIDGYKEHLLVPYGYVDGSTPIELVTSPIEPQVAAIRNQLQSIFDVVDKVDPQLVSNCHNKCGMHQTIVFDHLKSTFPPVVVANTIQMIRIFSPAIFYLLSSGHKHAPTRKLEFRDHNPSIWRRGLNQLGKYTMVYPRLNNAGCWGIEFRYPDGTMSTVLPGVTAVVNAAIVMKAISLSRFGVLKFSDNRYSQHKALVTDFVSRYGQNPENDSAMKILAEEFIRFISEEIEEIDKNAMPIIGKLLAEPIWARFSTYDDMKRPAYATIDANLSGGVKLPDDLKNKLEKAILLDSSTVCDMKNTVRRLASKMDSTFSEVNQMLGMNNYVWNQRHSKFVQRE